MSNATPNPNQDLAAAIASNPAIAKILEMALTKDHDSQKQAEQQAELDRVNKRFAKATHARAQYPRPFWPPKDPTDWLVITPDLNAKGPVGLNGIVLWSGDPDADDTEAEAFDFERGVGTFVHKRFQNADGKFGDRELDRFIATGVYTLAPAAGPDGKLLPLQDTSLAYKLARGTAIVAAGKAERNDPLPPHALSGVADLVAQAAPKLAAMLRAQLANGQIMPENHVIFWNQKPVDAIGQIADALADGRRREGATGELRWQR